MVGIFEATMPAGADGICGYSEADERPLLWCFPHSAVLSTTAGDPQESKRTRGGASCPVLHSK